MTAIINLVLLLLALPVVLASLYLCALAVLSWFPLREPIEVIPILRFDIVVPAHNEADGIASTLESLRSLDYPAALRRIIVVADNCIDDTAARARALGAFVIEREDATLRGKGYALATAFDWAVRNGRADAIVVVDADTVVSRTLLKSFAARLNSGAAAIQGDYAVRNCDDSWRTRLMTIAFALFHQVRSVGREHLRVSSGLRGNGMCFSAKVLRDVRYDAFSLVEDVEYGIALGRAGYRVHYAPDARVFGDMVSGRAAARTQRERWELGRQLLRRSQTVSLMAEALRRRSAVLLDLAIDLAIPPLVQLATFTVALLFASTIACFVLHSASAAIPLSIVALLGLGIYVATGWHRSRTGVAGLLVLLRSPSYALWKLTQAFKSQRRLSHTWVRTTREERRAP